MYNNNNIKKQMNALMVLNFSAKETIERRDAKSFCVVCLIYPCYAKLT